MSEELSEMNNLELNPQNNEDPARPGVSKIINSDSFDEAESSEDEDIDRISEIPGDPASILEFAGKQKAICLFCDRVLECCQQCFSHMLEEHNVNLIDYCVKQEYDQIDFIQLINYSRKNRIESLQCFLSGNSLTLSDEFMQPELDEDALLQYDMEHHVRKAGVKEKPSTYEQLMAENEELKSIVVQMKKSLENSMEQLLQKTPSSALDISVTGRSEETDSSYSESYSNHNIHHEMLNDKSRTLAYQKALCSNPSIIKGAKVLDIGCGTGILSMFAATAGASRVAAVDMAEIAIDAMEIVRANDLHNIVTVMKGKFEQLNLGDEKFDVIVSEWMGYFLLFEGMIDTVLMARDKLLKPGGVMMPSGCTMSLSGIDCQDLWQKHIGFWSDVYGYRMDSIGKQRLRVVPCVECHSGMIATESATILDLDLATCSVADTNFSTDFTLVPSRTTSLTAICGYFKVDFSGPDCPVTLCTSPHSPPTHWKQAVFFLPRPLSVERGIPVSGNMTVNRCASDARSLVVNMKLAGQKHHYTID